MLPIENISFVNRKEVFQPSDVALTAMVHYPRYEDPCSFDKVRGDAALDSARKAIAAGYTVVWAVSAETTEVFRYQIPENLAVSNRFPGSDRLEGSTNALHAAAKTGREIIVYHQAEKLLAPHLPVIFAPFADPEHPADLVIPSRDPVSFKKGYPPFQVQTETEANATLHQMLCRAGLRRPDEPVIDLMFGVWCIRNTPEILSKALGIYEEKDQKQLTLAGTGIDVISSVRLLAEGCRIATPTMYFRMPKGMKEWESQEGALVSLEKRRRQAATITGRVQQYLQGDLIHLYDFLHVPRAGSAR